MVELVDRISFACEQQTHTHTHADSIKIVMSTTQSIRRSLVDIERIPLNNNKATTLSMR